MRDAEQAARKGRWDGFDSDGFTYTDVVGAAKDGSEVLCQLFNRAAHEIIETSLGGREQEPQWWIAACEQALGELVKNAEIDRGQIKGIGVSGQQHGLVPLDSRRKVIRPAKLWCDTETALQCRLLTERVGGEAAVLGAIGSRITAGHTASKVLWLKEREPQNYERLDAILLPHDYLNYRLTGECTMENGDASGAAFFDIRHRCWSDAASWPLFAPAAGGGGCPWSAP